MSDAQWLTYKELAAETGLTVRAAEARARRQVKAGRWRHRIDNDTGAGRVLVTQPELDAMRRHAPGGAPRPLPDALPPALPAPGMDPSAVSALLAEVKAAHEQVAGELREAADELRRRAERAEGEAAALEDALVRERARAEAAAAEREQARVQAAAAEGEAKGLREALAEARRPFWRRWLGVVALCAASGLWPAVALAQMDPHSATWVMPGCRASFSSVDRETYKQGICNGIVSGIVFMDPDTCAPKGVTLGQMIRVVVHHIDARPARQHESFAWLALEALRAAWPCPR